MIRLARRLARYTLLVALSAAALLLPAAPASAARPVVDLSCVTTVTTDIHPGVSPELRHFTVNSGGLTGTSICTGTINGEPVTGPGMFAINDQVVGNCFEATGSGTFVLRIPTAGGTKTVAGRFDLTARAATGTVHTGDLTGTSRVIAAVGDCINTPVTQSTAVLTDHVT